MGKHRVAADTANDHRIQKLPAARWAARLAFCGAAVLVAGACGDDETGGSGGSGGSAATGGSGVGGGSGAVGGTGGTTSSGGAGPCAATACNDTSPDATCETCIDANCAAESAACLADSQSGACIGCAEFLGGGTWEDTCPASKTIFATFLECICGVGQTAGACN